MKVFEYLNKYISPQIINFSSHGPSSKIQIFIQTAEARREVVPKDLDRQASSRRQLKNELKYALLLNQVESNKISVVVTPFTPYIPIRKINRKYNLIYVFILS